MQFSWKLWEIFLQTELNFFLNWVKFCWRLNEIFLTTEWNCLKLDIHISFLAFWHVCALLRELFCEIANQSLYTSPNIADFIYLWFCEKLDEKFVPLSSLKFRENNDHLREWRNASWEKNDWRDRLRNVIYTLLGSLVSPTFFRVIVNLTISV